MRRALTLTLTLASTVGLVLTAAVPSKAATVTALVTHPSVAAQPVEGRYIHDLAVHNGEIYMGYGNYTSNTGPIDVATYNIATGATGVKTTVPTEEINTFRSIGGRLYIPWVDPTGSGGIYTSNSSGTWQHYGTNVPTEHIFDVAVLPNGVQVAVGSANSGGSFGGATAFVSRDGGATWQAEMRDLTSANDPDVSGFERYYWVAVVGGKAYLQARDSGAVYGEATFPLRIFDGTSWSSRNKSADCFVGNGRMVEVFAGKAYCANGRVFTGTKTTTTGGLLATDFFNAGTYLYGLTGSSVGTVRRTSGNAWETVATFTLPSGTPRSIAVHNGVIYIGSSTGTLYRIN